MAAEEKFDELGKESNQKRTAARTEERFPVEFERISESEARSLERLYMTKRTAERESVAVAGTGGGDDLGDQFSTKGATQAQIQMFQQTVRLLRQVEDKLDQVLAAVTGKQAGPAKRQKAMCIDLSSGGMRLITGVPLGKGDFLKILIPLPPLHPVTVGAIGKAVKISEVLLASGKKACEAAIQFTAINEEDQEEIVSYSFKRQRQEAFKTAASSEGEKEE